MQKRHSQPRQYSIRVRDGDVEVELHHDPAVVAQIWAHITGGTIPDQGPREEGTGHAAASDRDVDL